MRILHAFTTSLILLSLGACGFGTAQRYQDKKLAEITHEYSRRGIYTYREVPLLPVAFLVDSKGTRMEYRRSWYENPVMLMEDLDQERLKVARYVVAVEGEPLHFSKEGFLQLLRGQINDPRVSITPVVSACQFTKWWNPRDETVVLLAERRHTNTATKKPNKP
jgi:hypothetical protein